MVTRLLLASLVLPCALAAQPPPPSPAPPRVSFAVEVGYVEIDAIVTDAAGQPIRDLTPSDFEVLEDGRPQAIELFTRVDLPYERPTAEARRAPEPDVRTNERAFEGRVYVIVLDEMHTAALRTPLVRAAARRFLERHFAEGDLGAVVHAGGAAGKGQELTTSRARLLAAVDRFVGRKLPSVTMSRLEEYRRQQGIRQPGDRVRDPAAAQRAYDARATLDTLRGVSEALAGIRGRRKAVLFVSEGLDIDPFDTYGGSAAGRSSAFAHEASLVRDEMERATAAAAAANVSFYTIDPRGLGGLSGEMMEIQPVFDEPAEGLDPQGLAADLRRSQDSLRTLAERTLGQAAVNTNDFTDAFARLVKDNSAYYVLGYKPPDDGREGRHHRLEVRVKRAGARVRARPGYTTPRGRKEPKRARTADTTVSPAVTELVGSPLPHGGLPLTVQAAALRGEGKAKGVALVTVQVGSGAFRFVEKDGRAEDTLELSIFAVDASARTFGGSQKVSLTLQPRTRPIVEQAGFRVLQWVDLAPGRYQVRVAGRAVNADRLGSVHADLEVPDFARDRLAMSDLLLASAAAAALPTAGEAGRLRGLLPAPPTTWRGFHPRDTLHVLAEIYDREKQPHTLDVVTSLVKPDGSVAWRAADERSTAAAGTGADGVTLVHTAQVALAGLAPGAYTLRVEARSRLGKEPPAVTREVPVELLAP